MTGNQQTLYELTGDSRATHYVGLGGCAAGTFTGWHTYGVDWEPGSVTYYYDGHQVGQITSGVISAPMYLILNDAVPGGGYIHAPSTMKVDYVRVWRHA